MDSNHVANEVLSSNDGLIVDRCGLKGHTRGATLGLHELIVTAISPDRQLGSDVTDTILLDRPSGRPSLAVTIGRLPLASRFLGTDRRAAAIYVTDPQKPFDLDSSKLRQLYRLTPAEARLPHIWLKDHDWKTLLSVSALASTPFAPTSSGSSARQGPIDRPNWSASSFRAPPESR